MFELFTDRSRRVLVYAQDEARDLEHAFIGTEHIVLGLIREADGVAARAIDALGVTYDVVRGRVQRTTEREPNTSSNSLAFTSRAKKTIEMSMREAQALRHSSIGTEHLLLGLVRQGRGAAVRILNDLGIEVSQVRAQVLELMSISNVREIDEPRAQVPFDDTLFRGLVHALGQQLRPDLEAAAIDEQADQIAHDLLTQLRQRWVDPGNPV